MDKLVRLLNLDLSQGLEVLDAARVAERPPAGDLPALIRGLTRRLVAGVKEVLVRRYGPEHPVTLCVGEKTQSLRLHDLNDAEWADYGASLYLPPQAGFGTGGSRWPADPLVEVMARLRAPDGCPWDREQDHRSLRRYLLEEAYEAVEAIDSGDPRLLCEELGDVLLQVVFHAQVAREAGAFDFNDVVEGITAKLIRRHPHVFGDVVAETAEDVTRNWEAIKRAEKGGQTSESVLGKIPMSLPALSRAALVQKRAAKVGFDWPDASGPAEKVEEELREVMSAPPAQQEEEVGDLLFACVNLARKLGIDPEVALGGAASKFTRRFRYIEKRAAEMGRSLFDLSLDEMDALWEEYKRAK